MVADPGRFAFVSQGSTMRAIDFITLLLVNDVDLRVVTGFNRVQLRGIDAARPDFIEIGPADFELRSYLHVIADVELTPGDGLQPWYFVLDQEILANLAPGNPIVAEGPLLVPDVPNTEAMEVTVLGGVKGPAIQRAWYTMRNNNVSPPRIVAVEIGLGRQLGFSTQIQTRVFESPGGNPFPLNVRIGAPHSRELSLLPLFDEQRLLDLNSNRECPTAPGFLPIGASVTGPGLCSYEIWTLLQEQVSGDNFVQRSRFVDCDQGAPVPIGDDPVDLTTRGRVNGVELYVANRASDTVTVIQSSNPNFPISINLAPPSANCQRCPRSLAVQERPETICRAVQQQVELINGGADLQYTWETLGCLPGVPFSVWCKCDDASDCDSVCLPSGGAARTGELWEEVDIVNAGNQSTTTRDSSGTQQSNIEPKDN